MSDRHPSTANLLSWFDYEHLPEHLQGTSKQFGDFARSIAASLPDSPELAVGLRKLLEAKDCIVRATVETTR